MCLKIAIGRKAREGSWAAGMINKHFNTDNPHIPQRELRPERQIPLGKAAVD